MLSGETKIVADFKTSNNLNGSFPISSPNNAIITISEELPTGLDFNNEVELIYDSDLQMYTSEVTNDFLKRNKTYVLTAKIENSEYDSISSKTIVPNLINIINSELISEREIEMSGEKYWEGTVGLTFVNASGFQDRYGHLVINDRETIRNISAEGDTTYIHGSEFRSFDLFDVNVGVSAITDILHRDGFMIDFSKLENDYLEIVLRSPFPISDSNQVTDFLYTDLFAVTKEHYNYHVSLHNIKKSQGNIYDENVLFLSNINNGLGLFSSCVNKEAILELR